MSVAGRRVLVVGGSDGIGRATALAAAAAGARVAVAARRRADGVGEATLTGDVRRPADCERIATEAVAALGGLDALVYAPAQLPLARLADVDAAQWHSVLETNVIGAALVTRAALPHLRAARGHVVYLSSDAVPRPRVGLVPYVASKAALDSLLAGWRVEVRDVTFTRVVVGPTVTGISASWDPALAAELFGLWSEEGLRYDVVMTPEQVAAEIVNVLASDVRVEDLVVQGKPS